MPTWPATLPDAPLCDSYRESMPSTLLRTEMDQGPAKVRRRSTAAVRRLTLSFIFDTVQINTLESFIDADLSGGALSFSFTHPRSGSAIRCRFRQMPEYASLNGVYFKTQIELEVLP